MIQLTELYVSLFSIYLDKLSTDQVFYLELPFIVPNRLSTKERDALVLPSYLKEVLIGLILGDAHGRCKSLKKKAALFIFKQSIIHKDYLYHLFALFKDFCPGVPSLTSYKDNRNDKVYNSVVFNTYTASCFIELYNLFYIDNIKIIPSIIGELLTPVSLAYWICDDGSYNKVGKYVTLCTDSYQLAEVELLIEVLNKKFNLNCYKVKNGKNFRIIIPARSLPILIKLVDKHLPSMMRYKLGL